MAKERYTIYQRLTDLFGPDGDKRRKPTSNNYNIGNEVLIKTQDKQEYEVAKLQAQQQKYLGQMWKKVDGEMFQQSMHYEVTRIGSYSDFESMEFYPEISAALDIFMEESTTPNDKGKILNIYSESKRVKKILEDLFFNRLDIHTNLPMWTRNLCKYGDDFVYLNTDDKAGIIGCRQMPNFEMERREGDIFNALTASRDVITNNGQNKNNNKVKFYWKGRDIVFNSWQIAHFRLLGDDRKLPYGTCLKGDTRINTEFGVEEIKDIKVGTKVWSFNTKTQEKELSPILDKVMSGTKEVFKISTKHNFVDASKEHRILVATEDGNFIYKNVNELKVGDLLVLNKNEHTNQIKKYDFKNRKTDNFILEPIESIESIGKHKTYDIYVENDNHNFYANNIVVHNSVLEKARRIWKQLLLSEDAMLIYRVTRAPERRIYKIYVGNIDDQDVEPYVNEIANRFKRRPVIDPQTGQIDLRYNQLAQDQDLFVPVRDENAPTPIDTLPGANNLSEIADIKYLQHKLFTALRVPKTFLGFEEAVGEGKNLALQDIRFSRTINRIQQAILMELNKIAIIHLYILGFTDDLDNFILTLNNPSTQAEMLKIEHLQAKVTLYNEAVRDSGNGFAAMSMTRAKRDILGWSDEEIKQDLLEQRMEKAAAAELEKTAKVIKHTGLFDKVDMIYGDPNYDPEAESAEGAEGGKEGVPGGAGGGGFAGGSPSFGAEGGEEELDFGEKGGEAGAEAGAEGGEEGDLEFGEGEEVPAEEVGPVESLKKAQKLIAEQKHILQKKLEQRTKKYQSKFIDKLTNSILPEDNLIKETTKIYDKGLKINENINNMIDDIDELLKEKE